MIQLLPHINDVSKKIGNNGYAGKPITEILTNGFFTVDREWTVKYWNRAAEQLLGVLAKDIVGKNLWEEFAEVIPIEFYRVYQKAFQQDLPVHFEEYFGEIGAWFDVISFPGKDTLSVSFKSSHQLYTEYPVNPHDRLNAMTELYKFVTEVTNDCLWEWDLRDEKIFWIDGGHKRVFGYPVQNALIPQSFWESRLHPEDKKRILAEINKILAAGHGSFWEAEYRFKKADGTYAHVHDRGHLVYDKYGKAVRMIGATQDITERVLLENKLEQERTIRQQEITYAVLAAQEKDREDIGKELHDNLGQILAVAKLYLQMAKKNKNDPEMYIEKSCGFIQDVMTEIRKMAKKLILPGKHIIGLFDNIENLINDVHNIHPIKIEFYKTGIDEEYLDEKIQLNIFRIVQEQLNNIIKHSDATSATINLRRHQNEIQLLITDNGKGFDTSENKKGVGLINIKSRAGLYHGTASIVSEPGKGCELKVVLQDPAVVIKEEIVS